MAQAMLSTKVLGEADTGLPLSKIGSIEFIQEITRKIAFREGFGDILAQGTLKAVKSVGPKSQKFVSFLLQSRSSELGNTIPA